MSLLMTSAFNFSFLAVSLRTPVETTPVFNLMARL